MKRFLRSIGIIFIILVVLVVFYLMMPRVEGPAVSGTNNVLQEGDVTESRYAVCRRDRTIHGRMRDYLYELMNNDELESVILSGGDGMAVSIKKER